MKSTIVDYKQLKFDNESDVEQKFLYQFLTAELPFGLGYSNLQLKTKPNIKTLTIDKGAAAKPYFPDYVVLISGLPILIVEAKQPGEDLGNAYREARLYAHEINATFGANVNPCAYILVSDGLNLMGGKWDAQHELRIDQGRYDVADKEFAKLIDMFGVASLSKFSNRLKQTYRGGTKFLKPTQLLGGRMVRSESVGENSFGVNLALEYRYLFNPQSDEERQQIIENAYVESRKRQAHVSPIDKIIRASVMPSHTSALQIESTKKPVEIIRQVQNKDKVTRQICLLIGSVGAGKSTFVEYLRHKALPKELLETTHWLSIDLNTAPVVKDRIYTWILDNAIAQLRSHFDDFDFDDNSFIQKVFSRQLQAFKKGPISYLDPNSSEYKTELYRYTKTLLKDVDGYFNALVQYFFVSRGVLLICVLDNCDTRNRESQLLMFQVANWLRSKFELMVFLPLRETTYDIYRNEPPLDTVIKDLVFRIDPPLLISVIQKRIEYAYRQISVDQSDFHYYLNNGAAVRCKRSEIENYLKVILYSLFENDFFSRLIRGLAGRNIRRGLELFLDFCKSGHLSEEDIFKMRTATAQFQIPNHIITRVLLRGTRLFYDESGSRIKNLFHSDFGDTIPDPFVRISILDWLKSRFRVPGPTMMKGYHPVAELIADLTLIGHEESVIIRELEALLTNEYIISETQEFTYEEDLLVSITSAGSTLLDLLSNVDYLATVAEDSSFRDLDVAKGIANNLSGLGQSSRFSKQNTLENASLFVEYLIDYKKTYWLAPSPALISDNALDQYLESSAVMVQNVKASNREFVDFPAIKRKFPIGSEHEGQIVSIQPYGLMIELGLHAVGLVHSSNLPPLVGQVEVSDSLEVGQWVRVKIIRFEEQKKKFALQLANEN